YLIDGNAEFVLLHGIVTFVSRETGEVRDVPAPLNLSKIAAMRPV
ncbi:MAG: hypothetical protein JWM31_225, partial [Solirubrobacterales bacterium]|nr:hypothetical protein [Solirubrobacterales bacterium]